MRYYTTDLYGQTLVDPSPGERLSILQSVVQPDPDIDYPDVHLTHRDGPTLIYREGGFLVREHESGEVEVLRAVSVERASRIWDLLVAEDFAALEALPWEAEDEFPNG